MADHDEPRLTRSRVIAALAPWLLVVLAAAPFALGYFWELGDEHVVWGRRWGFLLAAALPIVGAYLFHARRRAPTMLYTRTADLAASARSLGQHLVHLPRALRLVTLGLLVVAFARPQRESTEAPEVEGIDIVIALDVSNSMSERDMAPDRITAAKEVLKSFIHHRKSDRVGLVIFGRDAFTQCPLTLDYQALSGLLDDVRLGLIDGRGTAIGNALGTALNRLRHSDARSRIIILLTDGDNNAGNLSPLQAARYAQALGVKVFTILMGRDVDAEGGTDRYGNPIRAQTRYPVNPKLLETIAQETGGTPYLATDTPALEKRFQSILDELERSRIKEQRGHKEELYVWFTGPALLLLLLELLLSLTRFRRFP